MSCKVIETICDYCKEVFYFSGGRAHYNRHVNHFCSKKCSQLSQRLYPFNPLKDLRYRMLSGAKRRAKTKGFTFNLTLDDIPEIPEYCVVLGIKIEPNPDKVVWNNSPSLDRIDSSLGYVKGNVRIISHRANSLKSNATVEELLLVLKDLKSL